MIICDISDFSIPEGKRIKEILVSKSFFDVLCKNPSLVKINHTAGLVFSIPINVVEDDSIFEGGNCGIVYEDLIDPSELLKGLNELLANR